MTNRLIEERMKNMQEDEVPEVWRITELTDDELTNTDRIIQNWVREIEEMRKDKGEQEVISS